MVTIKLLVLKCLEKYTLVTSKGPQEKSIIMKLKAFLTSATVVVFLPLMPRHVVGSAVQHGWKKANHMSGTIDGSMVAIPRMPIPRKHSFETLQTYQGLQQAICIDSHLAGDHNILGVGVATGGSAFAKYTVTSSWEGSPGMMKSPIFRSCSNYED